MLPSNGIDYILLLRNAERTHGTYETEQLEHEVAYSFTTEYDFILQNGVKENTSTLFSTVSEKVSIDRAK